jgi:hypothetical protein
MTQASTIKLYDFCFLIVMGLGSQRYNLSAEKSLPKFKNTDPDTYWDR